MPFSRDPERHAPGELGHPGLWNKGQRVRGHLARPGGSRSPACWRDHERRVQGSASTSSMISVAFFRHPIRSHPGWSASASKTRAWCTSINAFQSAQPRPRAHVASSRPSASRNARRLFPWNSVHAIGTSHAGSPTAEQPKSMTADNSPSTTRRFVAATSPWTQTGGPLHSASRAAFQTAMAVSPSICPSSAAIAPRVCSSHVVTGPPRK